MSLVPTKGRPIVSSDAKEKLKNTGNRIKDVIGSSASSAKGVLDAEFNRTRAGTRSMKAMVIAMIREEPDDGRFVDANPTMKNIYLVHQMISDQEKALADYIRLVKALEEMDPSESRKNEAVDYE